MHLRSLNLIGALCAASLLACGTQEVSILSSRDAGLLDSGSEAPDLGPLAEDLGTIDPGSPDMGSPDMGALDMGEGPCALLSGLQVESFLDGYTQNPPRLASTSSPLAEFALMTIAADGPELGSAPYVPEVRRYRASGPWISNTRKAAYDVGQVLGFSVEFYTREGPNGSLQFAWDYAVFAQLRLAPAASMTVMRGWSDSLQDLTITATIGRVFGGVALEGGTFYYTTAETNGEDTRVHAFVPETQQSSQLTQFNAQPGFAAYDPQLFTSGSNIALGFTADWDFPRTVFVEEPALGAQLWNPMCGARSYDVELTLAQTLIVSDCEDRTLLTLHPRGTGGPPVTVQVTERPSLVPSKVLWDGAQIIVVAWEESDPAPAVHYLDTTGVHKTGKLLLPDAVSGLPPVGLDLAAVQQLDSPVILGVAYSQSGTTQLARFSACQF